jgi:hypothetical protein
MATVFIGIDNGVSGSIAIIAPEYSDIFPTPVTKQLNYTKEKAWINRVNFDKMLEILTVRGHGSEDIMVALERPMLNPMRWKASISAARCMEATQIILEHLKYPYEWLDSKQWQKVLLPNGLEGDELKKASLDVGKRIFPQLAAKFKKDADAMLIAQFLKQRETRTL